MKKCNKKGFTLVELVIVIAVIAILAGVMIATFSNVVEKANSSKALQEAKSRIDAAYMECLSSKKDVKYIGISKDGSVYFDITNKDADYTYYSLTVGKNGTPNTVSEYISLEGGLYFVITKDGYSVVDSKPNVGTDITKVESEPDPTEST